MKPQLADPGTLNLSCTTMNDLSEQMNVLLKKIGDVLYGRDVETSSLKGSCFQTHELVNKCIRDSSKNYLLNKHFCQFLNEFESMYNFLRSLPRTTAAFTHKCISQLREACKKIKFLFFDFGMNNLAKVKSRYDAFIALSPDDFVHKQRDDFFGPFYVPASPDIFELIPDLHLEPEPLSVELEPDSLPLKPMNENSSIRSLLGIDNEFENRMVSNQEIETMNDIIREKYVYVEGAGPVPKSYANSIKTKVPGRDGVL